MLSLCCFVWVFSSCGPEASHCVAFLVDRTLYGRAGFLCCTGISGRVACALRSACSVVAAPGLATPPLVGSSQIRDWNPDPWIATQTLLNHWFTREAPGSIFSWNNTMTGICFQTVPLQRGVCKYMWNWIGRVLTSIEMGLGNVKLHCITLPAFVLSLNISMIKRFF